MNGRNTVTERDRTITDRRAWEPVRCIIGPEVNLQTDLHRDECVEALMPHGWLVRRRADRVKQAAEIVLAPRRDRPKLELVQAVTRTVILPAAVAIATKPDAPEAA